MYPVGQVFICPYSNEMHSHTHIMCAGQKYRCPNGYVFHTSAATFNPQNGLFYCSILEAPASVPATTTSQHMGPLAAMPGAPVKPATTRAFPHPGVTKQLFPENEGAVDGLAAHMGAMKISAVKHCPYCGFQTTQETNNCPNCFNPI